MWVFDRWSPYSYQNNKEKYKDDEEKRIFGFKECLWFCMTSLTPQVSKISKLGKLLIRFLVFLGRRGSSEKSVGSFSSRNLVVIWVHYYGFIYCKFGGVSYGVSIRYSNREFGGFG